MKLNKIIRSLKQVNSDTADKIMRNYPAEFDTDKVFDRSLKKYLSQKDMQSSDEKRPFLNFFKRGRIVLATTAYIGVFLLIMNIADKSPSPVNNSPDGLINQNMITVQSEPKEIDKIPQKEASSENGEKSSENVAKVTKENANSTVASAETSTATEPENQPSDIQIPGDVQIPNDGKIPHDVQIPNNGKIPNDGKIPHNVQPPDTTENPTKPVETSDITIPNTTMNIPESTVPDDWVASTQPPQSGGYFEVQHGAYDNYGKAWDRLVFVPADDNVDIREHSFEVEGFTLISEDLPYHTYNLKAENGAVFPIYRYPYEHFIIGLNPEIERTYQFSEIDGKEVFREFLDKQGALELTAWNDGCHVCFMFATREDYDTVEYLIRNLT